MIGQLPQDRAVGVAATPTYQQLTVSRIRPRIQGIPQRLQHTHSHLGQRAEFFLESIGLLLGGWDRSFSLACRGTRLLLCIRLWMLPRIRLVLPGVLVGALEAGRFDEI